ncbi:hypothetical protein MPL3356_60520 [Mesorhizobium plurifarium]|uniref:Uncharacterized protein n=1 Tax=Mesorhizobium plurifarium TaxID=69974 RepID=A0A090E9Y0_MESPL|nr:hypothetical protein MPL3356_60520 [Mesorhizobium plurifarium]
MTRPTTFPFLAIAKKYNVDYGDVLIYADKEGRPQQFRRASARLHRHPYWNLLISEINRAQAEQAAIRRGEIDWLTGERK